VTAADDAQIRRDLEALDAAGFPLYNDVHEDGCVDQRRQMYVAWRMSANWWHALALRGHLSVAGECECFVAADAN